MPTQPEHPPEGHVIQTACGLVVHLGGRRFEPALGAAGSARLLAGGRKPAPDAPRRTQAGRREEAERRLLDAALDIVVQRGSVRMTLAEVAEAAGYSRGLPAHRFGNKAGLLHALAGYIGERFSQQREQGPALAPGLAAIVGNIRFYFSREGAAWTSTRALLVMMTESGMTPNSALRQEVTDYNRSALAWFEQHIRIGIERGEVNPATDPASTAVVVLGAMRGVMLQCWVDGQINLPATLDCLLQIVEQALQRR